MDAPARTPVRAFATRRLPTGQTVVAHPNAPLRAAATAYGRDLPDDPDSPAEVASPPAAPAPSARSPPISGRCCWRGCIGDSHYRDQAGRELSHLAPARYFCTQCHVSQVDAKPLVENTFHGLQKSDAH
jgi:hypothetical protein